MLAWFDPEGDETLCVTDLKKEHVWTLRKETRPQACNDVDLLSDASAQTANANRRGRARYSELRARFVPPSRALLADPAALEFGREMAHAGAAARNAAKEKRRLLALADEALANLKDDAPLGPEVVAFCQHAEARRNLSTFLNQP